VQISVSKRPVLASVLLSVAAAVGAETMPVPVATHVAVLSRVLELDRNMGSGGHSALTVCILFQGGLRESAEAARLAKEAFTAAGKVKGLPLRIAPVDLDSGARLEAVVAAGRADIVYVCPLRSVSADSITAATRAAKALSLTGVPSLVEKGISLGVDLKAGKPEIILNLAGAQAEGADFGSDLVKVARVVK
jgi:hypothetical protein